jgi:hypothetical protein
MCVGIAISQKTVRNARACMLLTCRCTCVLRCACELERGVGPARVFTRFPAMDKVKESRCLEDIAGRWKVQDVPVETGRLVDDSTVAASRELRGLVLVLEAQGDVLWEVAPGAHEDVPLFETTSAYLHKNSLTFLGGGHGWSVTFVVKGEPEKGWMVLESEEEGVELLLSLAKEDAVVELVDDQFSLSRALDDSLFSDVHFVCCDRRKVEAHRAVLAAAYPSMEEKDWEAVFQTQPRDTCCLLLSCIYSDRLPANLKTDEAMELVEWLGEYPSLERLTCLVTDFIRANSMKQRLTRMIDDLLTLLQDAKKTVSSADMSDPVKVKYTLKQLSKDAVLGGAKVCLLCHMYARNRSGMGKADWKEVLEHLRFRVVGLLDLVKEVAEEAVRRWEGLTQDQQMEISTELIPDIEQAWDMFLSCGSTLSQSLREGLPAKSEPERGTTVSMVLHLLSHGSERKRLRKIRKELLESVEMAQSKREWWERCSEEEKAGQVLNVVGKLVNEIEDLQESMAARKRHLLLENGLEWNTFRSYVDIACTYMSWGLQKVLALKESVKQLLLDGLQFVGKSEVKEAALSLGLLEAEELESLVEEVGGEKRIEHLFPLGPPGPRRSTESALAQGCVELAASQQFADMEFVLGERVIPAHRVIMASRSNWVCQALQSGMREAKERSIKVSDVDEHAFHLFIKFLYGAPLSMTAMKTETVVELMLVADRWEPFSPSYIQLAKALPVQVRQSILGTGL